MTRLMARWVYIQNVVQVFDLSNDSRCLACGIYLIHDRLVGAAVVYGDLFGNTAGLDGFLKKVQVASLVALGRQQEDNRFALLVCCAVEILPVAFDLDKHLIHGLAATHLALVLAKDFFMQGQIPDCPAVD